MACSSLQFEGSASTYVSINRTGNLADYTGDFTFSAWIYPIELRSGEEDYVMSIPRIVNSDGIGLMAHDASGTPRTVIHTGSDVSNARGDTSVVEGEWQHVAGTYDGTTVKFYLDGVEGAALTKTLDPLASSQPLLIGVNGLAGHLSSRGFIGYISSASVWNFALSDSEILSLSLGTDALEIAPPDGYWLLNDGEGSSASDLSGNDQTGTIIGASWAAECPW